jgi:DNA-binding CsgD family transcriptional regulator
MGQVRTLQSPLLVGRDELLALAERRLGEVSAGHGGLLMLAGEAGIGKSRLVDAVAQTALRLGFRWSKGDLAPQDSLVSLASVLDLARWMAPHEFGSLGPDILEIRAGDGVDSLASRRMLVREIAERISGAIDRPTVLAFDDLQWADELTLEVIGELARLGRDRQLLLLVAYRLDELPHGSIHREWRSRLLTQRLGEEVKLGRLDATDTALVTTLILGTGLPAPREIAAAIYQRTNGIPLHIEELLAALGTEVASDPRSIADASVPDTIEDAVLVRMHKLSDTAQAVARAGAVMGRCFAPDVLAGIMNLPVSALDEPIEELVQSAVLHPFNYSDQGYYDFRHQLLRDALYATVPAAELRRLHARAGEFGAQLIGASEIHASLHYERAGLRAQAFRAALIGARAAGGVSSRYESFELYRRAVQNLPHDLPAAERGELYWEYATAAFAVDDIPTIELAAQEARTAYQEAGDALGAARALGALVGVARRDVRPRTERRRLLDAVDAELRALPSSPQRAAILGEQGIHAAMLEIDQGKFALARAALDAARTHLTESGAGAEEVDYFVAMIRTLEGETTGVAGMLDIARRARDAHLEAIGVTAYRAAAAVAIRVLDFEAAEIGLREGLRYADEIEQSYCRHVLAATSAHVAWARGNWDEAVNIAGIELVERGSRRGSLGSRDALAFVDLGRGNVERARALLDESLAVSRPSGEVELLLPAIWGLAEASIVAGDPARAFAHCEEAFELARQSGERALLVPFVVTGVRAALADRHPEAAQRWLREVRTFLDGWQIAGPALEHGNGLVQVAGGMLIAARSSLESALGGWDRLGRTWEGAWARLDLAAALQRSNRFVDAGRLLAEVLELSTRLDSGPLRDRAQELMRHGRGHATEEEAWYPLTVREFEVARHIAAGLTNPEIAEVLVVSPKTVSSHVEHILAKLGVNRRAEVATWVATVAQPVG